jgi:hypothetical protein
LDRAQEGLPTSRAKSGKAIGAEEDTLNEGCIMERKVGLVRAVMSIKSEKYQNNRDSEEIQDPEIASPKNRPGVVLAQRII